jgi:hypothetical protein
MEAVDYVNNETSEVLQGLHVVRFRDPSMRLLIWIIDCERNLEDG